MNITEEIMQDIRDGLANAIVCSAKLGSTNEKEHAVVNIQSLANHLSKASERAQQLYGIMYKEWQEGLG
jgi:capsular polysaccharide biosynthesis protein